MTDAFGLVLQVVLAGDSGVGKTCVLVRFAQNEFLSVPYISTIGVDFKVRVSVQIVTVLSFASALT